MPNEDYGTNSSQYNPTSGMAMYSGKTESSDALGGAGGYRPEGGEWAQLYKDLSDSQAKYWEQKMRDGEPGAQWQAAASQNIAKNWGSIASNPAQANSMRWAQGGFQPLIDRLQHENQDVEISPEMARYLSKNKAGAKPLPTGDLGGGNGTLTQQTSLFGSFGGPVSGGAAPDTTPQTNSFNYNSGYAGSGSPWTDAQMGRGSGSPFHNSTVGADPGRGMVDWNVGPMPGQTPIDQQRMANPFAESQNAALGVPGGGIAQQQGSAFQSKAPEARAPEQQQYDTSQLIAQVPREDAMGAGGMAMSRPQEAVPQPQMRNTEIQDPQAQQPDYNFDAPEDVMNNAAGMAWERAGKGIATRAEQKAAQQAEIAKYQKFKKDQDAALNNPNSIEVRGLREMQKQGYGDLMSTKERRAVDAADARGRGYNQGSGLDINPQTGLPFQDVTQIKQFAPQGDLNVMMPLAGGHGKYEARPAKDPLRYGTPFDDELYTNARTHMYQKGSNTKIDNRSTPFDDELYDRSGGKKFTKANHESLLRSNPPQNPLDAEREDDDTPAGKHAKIKAYMGKNPHIEKYLLSLA